MKDDGKQERVDIVLQDLPPDWRLHARQVIDEFSTSLGDLELALDSPLSLKAALEVVKTYQHALGRDMDRVTNCRELNPPDF